VISGRTVECCKGLARNPKVSKWPQKGDSGKRKVLLQGEGYEDEDISYQYIMGACRGISENLGIFCIWIAFSCQGKSAKCVRVRGKFAKKEGCAGRLGAQNKLKKKPANSQGLNPFGSLILTCK